MFSACFDFLYYMRSLLFYFHMFSVFFHTSSIQIENLTQTYCHAAFTALWESYRWMSSFIMSVNIMRADDTMIDV